MDVQNAAIAQAKAQLENSKIELWRKQQLVEKNFGTLRGDPSLNHASISYEEVRLGSGLEWKLSTATKLSFEGGYIPYRNFDFHRTQVRYHQDGGAPYARIGFHAAF